MNSCDGFLLERKISVDSYRQFLKLAQLCPFVAFEFKAEVLGGDILARRIAPNGSASPRCLQILVAADAITLTADCGPAVVTASLHKASLCIRQYLANMAAL